MTQLETTLCWLKQAGVRCLKPTDSFSWDLLEALTDCKEQRHIEKPQFWPSWGSGHGAKVGTRARFKVVLTPRIMHTLRKLPGGW